MADNEDLAHAAATLTAAFIARDAGMGLDRAVVVYFDCLRELERVRKDRKDAERAAAEILKPRKVPAKVITSRAKRGR